MQNIAGGLVSMLRRSRGSKGQEGGIANESHNERYQLEQRPSQVPPKWHKGPAREASGLFSMFEGHARPKDHTTTPEEQKG